MSAQELIYMLEDAAYETKEEWEKFRKKVYAIYNSLPEAEQKIIIEDNSFEMLSMIMSAFEE